MSYKPSSYIRLFALTILALIITSCLPANVVGPRPATNPATVVEAYLQKYQPGPLPRLFQTTYLYDRNGTLLADGLRIVNSGESVRFEGNVRMNLVMDQPDAVRRSRLVSTPLRERRTVMESALISPALRAPQPWRSRQPCSVPGDSGAAASASRGPRRQARGRRSSRSERESVESAAVALLRAM